MKDAPHIAFVSLGCAKNVVDSEKMLGHLVEAGCKLTADEDHADTLVINTCGFLQASREEADEVIREAVARKSKGTLKRVVVAGCLVQRDQTSILDRIPGVDALVGVNNRDDIARAVLGHTPNRRHRETDLFLSDYHPFVQMDTARLRITPRHRAYLRISEGCDQKCTFCTIPSIRGRMHCKPPNIILEEARELVNDGAVEISLIGQDTTSYGLGEDAIDGGLADLLRSLNGVDGLEWIRLMYVYPSVMSDDIIDAMAESQSVCKYIDIPLQHINDRILKSMHRRVDRNETESLLRRLRDRMPEVSIRTTMIVGFPGETEQEFNELVQFVRDFKFDALGAFAYSQEPDTPAGRMRKQLSEELKKERFDTLMGAQQEVAFALADHRTGQCFDILVEERLDGRRVVGRHRGQAPVVDGVTHVRNCDANPGQLVSVRCVGRDAYDLVATPVSEVSLPVLGK